MADNGGPTATHALLTGSPAINAGDPAFEGLQFDQRRDPFARIANGRVDIGAFELQPVLLGGDANSDGSVAFDDFLVLSVNFGRKDAVWADGDFNNDAEVNFADFLILAANFGQQR